VRLCLIDTENIVLSICVHLAAYLASSNAGGVVAASFLLLDVQLRDLSVLYQKACSAAPAAPLAVFE